MEKWKKSEFQNTCVKIEHVTKRFGEDLVLKEVNLTLKVGQVYGVVGVAMNDVPLDSFENSVLLSILGECALALENI